MGMEGWLKPAGGDFPHRKNVQLPREPTLILAFDYICCHFKAGIIRTLRKIVSEFGLLAKLLGAILQPRFGVLMWHHRSYRFWQWISPGLLPGRPCKVPSWVWSAELAVTSWVLSPSGSWECILQPLPLPGVVHFFPRWQQALFSHCLQGYLPWVSGYEKPDKSWPAQALTRCQGASLYTCREQLLVDFWGRFIFQCETLPWSKKVHCHSFSFLPSPAAASPPAFSKHVRASSRLHLPR